MELVTVGIDDGVMDSVAVRFAVGIELGVLVGVVVGISLEIVVGLLEGFSAGVDVGIKNVCVVLGAPLGDFVGTSVRNKVWYCEGSGVSDVGRDIEGADNVFGSSPFVGDRLGISVRLTEDSEPDVVPPPDLEPPPDLKDLFPDLELDLETIVFELPRLEVPDLDPPGVDPLDFELYAMDPSE